MPEVTIPDTDVFKNKAFNVAEAYHKLAALQLADFMHAERPAHENHSLESLNDVPAPTSDLMSALGYSLDSFSDQNLYGADGPITQKTHHAAVITAEKDFKEAKDSLYQQAAAVNSDLFRKTLHTYTADPEEQKSGKQKIQEALNEVVTTAAHKKGFRIPSDMDYYGTTKSMGIG